MRRALPALLGAAVVALAAVHVQPVQAVPKATHTTHAVTAKTDASVVQVGDVIRYSLVLHTRGALVVDATSPGKLDDFELLGTSSMPGESITIHNGVVEQSNTFTVTYRLRAKKPGKFQLGPGHFVVPGKTLPTPAVKVEVIPAGAAPKVHDPLADLLRDFDEPMTEPEPKPPAAPVDPLAQLDSLPTDPSEREFFVRVVPDERRPVVGSQVTLKVFVYARRPPEVMLKRPPVATDFRIVSLGAVDKMWHPIDIGGHAWSYAALEAFAAFPLRTGKLPIGPSVVGAGFSDMFGKPVERDFDSLSTEVESVEPPVEGRPPGYVLGDVVSNLQLTATVAPRTVDDGHALVTLQVSGAGRVDTLRPALPTPPGVTWTTTNDETHAQYVALAVKGTRKLQIDARFDRPGDVDLGEAVLHVWDPSKKEYATARAALGTVIVRKGAENPSAAGASSAVPLPAPRGRIGRVGEGRTIADRAWTWGLVAGAPLAVVLAQAGAALLRRRRAKESERAVDPGEQARVALAEARRGADPIAACVRALDRAVEATTSVRPRGVTRSELAAALSATQLDRALCDDLVRAFEALDGARFAGGAPPSVDAIERLVERVLSSSEGRREPRRREEGAS
ncbi:MAG: BatD family protein [Deltaproteobacteria bacterium]|nr:BatD family protein [Deltaproteobacteria bacterium]